MKTFPSTLSVLARLCAAAVLASASVACSGVSSSEPAPAPVSAPAPAAPAPAPVAAASPAGGNLMAQIKAEIGDAGCDTSSQCKTVPVGSKPCGGPEGYLAYSTKRGDSARIVRLAAEHAAARKGQDERSGMISNCMMMMDPGATCSAGRCVTGKGDLPSR